MNINISNVNITNLNDTSILLKVCSKCKQMKQLTIYNQDNQTDGLHIICKSCEFIVNKHYQDNIKQIKAYTIYNETDVKHVIHV